MKNNCNIFNRKKYTCKYYSTLYARVTSTMLIQIHYFYKATTYLILKFEFITNKQMNTQLFINIIPMYEY